jgi:transposase
VSAEERQSQVMNVITLIEHGCSERQACAIVGINKHAFKNWALKLQAGAQYARSLEALAHAQITAIEEVLERLERDDIDANAARVILDARKWFASKFLPKRYGESRTIEHSGIVQHVHELTDDQIRARLAALNASE